MLCASSITTRHGVRECRRFHSVDSTASATSRCSSIVPSEPRSTTVQRLLGLRSSSSSEGWSPAHTPQSSTPRLAARMPSWRAVGDSDCISSCGPEHDRPALLGRAEEVSQDGVLLTVPDGVEAEDRGLSRRGQLGEAQPQLTMGVRPGAPDGHLVRDSLVARSLDGVGALADAPQAHVVGVRVEDHHAKLGLGEHPLEEQSQRVGLAGARLSAHERVPVQPTAVEHSGDARCQQQLADRELGTVRARPGEPPVDLLRTARAAPARRGRAPRRRGGGPPRPPVAPGHVEVVLPIPGTSARTDRLDSSVICPSQLPRSFSSTT